MSATCVQIFAIDDKLIEDEEHFSVVVEVGNPSDIVYGNTSVTILDNDGILSVWPWLLNVFDLNHCTGVSLRVNQSVNIAEGEIQIICVLVENHQVSRERVIPISVSLVTKSITSGMFLCGPPLLTKCYYLSTVTC